MVTAHMNDNIDVAKIEQKYLVAWILKCHPWDLLIRNSYNFNYYSRSVRQSRIHLQ